MSQLVDVARYLLYKYSMQNPNPNTANSIQLPSKPGPFVLYFVKKFRWMLLLMIFFETGQATSQILLPYGVKKIMDAVASLTPGLSETQIWANLKPSIFSFVIFSLGILFFSRASGSCIPFVGPKMRTKVRFSLYQYLQQHSHRFFSTNFAGSLSNRISEVSFGVNHCIWSILFDFWPVFITFSVSIFLLTQINHQIALYLSSWIIIYVGTSLWLATKCRKYAKLFAAARSTVSGKIVDAVSNILNTKMFCRQSFEQDHLMDHLNHEIKTAKRTIWFNERMRWFQFIAALLLQVGMMGLAVKMWVNGSITVGSFAMVTSLSLVIINDARGLSRRFLEFFEHVGSMSDGVSIIIRPHEIMDAPNANELKIKNGEINFKNVSFSYGPGIDIFKNFNLTIRPGERVGLVGFSGSGKTTFVNLLMRLYDINAGSILIDGQDIAGVTQDSLRNHIGMIPQDPLLFHRTLRENIAYGKLGARQEEVIEAAKKAHAHEFIMRLPEAYDSLVGERGIRLSGGQRQRIAIARTLLKDAPIFILDEATSSLDSLTEKAIQNGLSHSMITKTVIVIAHRLSTLCNLDRILVFHDGKIIEDGAHNDLLAIDGHYARLWKMQADGFLPTEDTFDTFLKTNLVENIQTY